MLDDPLPGEARKKPDPFTEEEEAEGFMAFMAQHQGQKAG